MADSIHSNTRTALYATASAFLALFSGETAHAQSVNFYCGNVEFQLDTTRSTITNRFLSNEPIQWEYDGEWLRWTVTRSNEAFGVNVLNGYFISGGQSADAGCQIENPALLASLPLSEGAALRRVFVDLPPDVRRSVQDHLRFRGLYNSTIDGLWGRGTQAALLAYAASLPQEYFTQGDYRSEVGARIVFDQINLAIMEGEVCDGFYPVVSEAPDASRTNLGSASDDIAARREEILAEIAMREARDRAAQEARRSQIQSLDTHSPSDQPVILSAREATLALTVDQNSCGNAISLSGLCWTQSPSEMVDVLRSRGYSCEYRPADGLTHIRCIDGGEARLVEGRRNIDVIRDVVTRSGRIIDLMLEHVRGQNRDTILIDCNVFNGCQGEATPQQVASWLSEAGVADDFSTGRYQYSSRGLVATGTGLCAQGALGDRICITSQSGYVRSIALMRADFVATGTPID